MIIPSIDIMDASTVQLIGGKEKALDAGDPIPLAKKFALAGEIAVIDLDAAIGQGSNEEMIAGLLKVARCRVGGGIRSVSDARKWLDMGAAKVILGTAATKEILSQLPKFRVIAALDTEMDEVVVEGWRKKTGENIYDRIKELRDVVGGFLVTFVEREGRLGGLELERVKKLKAAAGNTKLTVAGGVNSLEDIALADKMGVDCQVGMAIYTGKMDFAEAIAAPLHSDRPDGLWPTVITDERGIALGLAYSDMESLKEAVDTGRGAYHSRSRGLWIKGLTSGDTQDLLAVDLDCDRDTIRFKVRQHGSGFCHLKTQTCWGDENGLSELLRRLKNRIENAPKGSYTKRLLDDPELLKSKLCEEALELAEASGHEEVVWESADLIYFALVAMIRSKVELAEVESELDRRSLKITRRPGNAKP